MHNAGLRRGTSHGFTLIELSIVLVIIGLIVGGVLVGRDLIRNAQLNTIITEKARYSTSVLAFREKYGQLPGDTTAATAIWGIAGGAASDNYNWSCYSVSTNMGFGKPTCNGDGDGLIGCINAQLWQTPCTLEGVMLWQHLADAGMLEGQYYPSFAPNNPSGVQQRLEQIGYSIPGSRSFANTGWSAWYFCVTSDAAVFPTNSCGNKLFFGAQSPVINKNWLDLAFYPVLTGADAKKIDLKIDDGKPATGIVTTLTNDSGGNPFTPNCVTSATATATYSTASSIDCSLIFNAGF